MSKVQELRKQASGKALPSLYNGPPSRSNSLKKLESPKQLHKTPEAKFNRTVGGPKQRNTDTKGQKDMLATSASEFLMHQKSTGSNKGFNFLQGQSPSHQVT